MRRSRCTRREGRRAATGHRRPGADRSAAPDPRLAAAGVLAAAADDPALRCPTGRALRAGPVSASAGSAAGGRPGPLLEERPLLTRPLFTTGQPPPPAVTYPGRTMARNITYGEHARQS